MREQLRGDEEYEDEDSDGSAAPQKPVSPDAEAVKVALPLQSRRKDPLPSPGSIGHDTGECRPCAWFHKSQGCSNGDQCRHCHLCDEGEIRDRRKVKVSALRRQNSGQQQMEQALMMVQKQQEILITAQWQAQAMFMHAYMETQQAHAMMQNAFAGYPTAAQDDDDDASDDPSSDSDTAPGLGSPARIETSALCTQ